MIKIKEKMKLGRNDFENVRIYSLGVEGIPDSLQVAVYGDCLKEIIEANFPGVSAVKMKSDDTQTNDGLTPGKRYFILKEMSEKFKTQKSQVIGGY